MSHISKQQLMELIKSKKYGEFDSCYGPYQIDDMEIWEVWVSDDGEYETRFVITTNDEAPTCLADFSSFCALIGKKMSTFAAEQNELKIRARSAESKNKMSWFRLVFSSIIFLLSIAFLFLLKKNCASGFDIWMQSLIGTIILSSLAYIVRDLVFAKFPAK